MIASAAALVTLDAHYLKDVGLDRSGRYALVANYSGGTVSSAISMKKKEPPHSTERKSRIAQSCRAMV